jgi:hypothetical protein
MGDKVFPSKEPITDIVISGGKTYALTYSGRVLIDGVEWEYGTLSINNYSVKFRASAIAVAGGRLYVAGSYGYFNASPVICFAGNAYTVICNNANTDEFIFIPDTVSVAEDGTAYVAGHSGSGPEAQHWYYANGEFTKIQGLTGLGSNRDGVKRITVSGGNVYVFKKDYAYGNEYAYWVNGEMTAFTLPEPDTIIPPITGSYVEDVAIFGGRMYMAGSYWNGAKYQACYWVDGVRYDLDGSVVTAVFVEE